MSFRSLPSLLQFEYDNATSVFESINLISITSFSECQRSLVSKKQMNLPFTFETARFLVAPKVKVDSEVNILILASLIDLEFSLLLSSDARRYK